MGIIPIVDFGVLAFVEVFRGAAEDRLGARLLPPVVVLDLAPLVFQPLVEPPFFRRGFLVYGRLRPLEPESACPPKSSPGSKPGDGGGGKYLLVRSSSSRSWSASKVDAWSAKRSSPSLYSSLLLRLMTLWWLGSGTTPLDSASCVNSW